MSVGLFRSQSRCTVLAAALAFLCSGARAQLTVTWGGSNASWNTGTNWLGSLLPGLSDNAQVSSGTPSVDSAVSIANLAFSGGSLGGTATLTLTGAGSTWSGGSMNSAGTLSIQSGATLAISTNTHDFISHAIVNNGTINWSGGQLRTGSGGSITNNGTFTDTTSDFLYNAFGGSVGTFSNPGTYNKNAAGTTTLGLPFANTGTLNVNSGTFNLNGGGSDSSGAKINVASGATLAVSSGTFTIASAADLVDHGGSYAVSGGSLVFTAGSTTLPSVAVTGGSLSFSSGGLTATNLSLSGGSLAGPGNYSATTYAQSGGSLSTTGSLTLTGTGSTWSGGDMNGAGTLSIQSGASLAITTNTHDFISRAIVNNGTITWTGGQLRTGSSGSITNNGTFTDTTSDLIYNAFGGSVGTFSNAGTYNKNAAGTTTLGLPFANTGTLNVNAGTFAINGGGSNSSGAKVNVASGAALNFTGGTYTFASAGDLVDSGGTYTVSGGTLAFTAGSLTLPNLTLSGGSINFTSGNLSAATLNFSGGSLAGPGSYTATTYAQTGGSLSTTGSLTLTGTGSTWSGGDMNGAGTLSIQSGASLAITTNTHDFISRAIVNNGTVTWTGGQLRTGSSGSITNNGTFTDTASDLLYNAFGGSVGSFSNSGTYNKNGAGTTTVGLPFTNTGTLNVNSGTFNINGGGSDSSGAKIKIASGAALNFSSGSFNFASAADLVDSGGSYVVSGGAVTFTAGSVTLPTLTISSGSFGFTAGSLGLTTLTLSGGSLGGAGSTTTTGFTESGGSINGSGTLTLTGPNATWSGGDMNGTGTLAIQSGTTLAISTNTHDFISHAIVNNGAIAWSGGQLRTGSSGSITNNGTFTDTASDYLYNAFGGTAGTFTNAGTYNKNAAGTTTLGLPFANTGTLNVNAGTFNLNGGGSSSSGFATASGATTIFSTDYTLASGATLTGAGQYSLTGGTLTIAGTPTVTNFTQSAGTLAPSGSLTATNFTLSGGNIAGAASGSLAVTGTLAWTSGAMNGSGTTTIGSGVTLALSDATSNVRDFNTHAIVNQGIVNWSSAYLRSGGGGSFTNAAGATFNDLNTVGYAIQNPFGGTFVFTNNGTYNRNATGTSYVDTTFNNNGAVNVQQGNLEFRGGGTLGASGTIAAASGTNVFFRTDYSVANGSSLTGLGTYWLTGGTFNVTGALATSTFDQTGGTLAGTNSIVGTYNWTGGNWNTGSLGPTTTIASGTTANLRDSNDNVRDFNFRAVTNQGTVNWFSGYVRSGNGGSFTNAAGATFNDLNTIGYTIQNPFGGSFVFTNNGTYNRNATGTSYLDTTFNNNGTLNVQQGNLEFRAGGTLGASGTIAAASGTNVFFRTDYNVASGSSLTGLGTYWLTGGTFNVTGALSLSTFNQTGGTLSGTNSIAGTTFNWTGGNWNTGSLGPTTTIGSGTTVNLSDASDNVRDFNFRAVTNQGTFNWNSGYLRSGNGGSFANAAGATFNDLNTVGYTIQNPFGGSFTFTNNGTYNRNATGTSYLDTTFNNNGALNLLKGDLQIRSGGTMSATSVVNAAAGTHLYFTSSYTLLDGAKFTGAGLFNQVGGTLTINGNLTASAFLWSGGNWNAAANSGLTTTIAAGTTLNLTDANDNVRDFSGRGIANQGTVNWTTGYLRSGNGGSFTNNGTFNDLNAPGYTIQNPFGGSFVFTNNGTYNRNATGTSYLDTTFNNNGTLSLQLGDLQLRAGGAMGAASVVNALAGTHLYFTASYTLLDGAQFTGAGLIDQIGGTMTIDGNLRASTFVWSGGDWNAANNSGLTTTIAASTTLNLSDANGNVRDFNGRGIANYGTVNWNSGYLRSGNGGSFINYGTFNDLNTPGYNIQNPFGGTFSFTNNGTYNRAVTGATLITVPFTNNNGLVTSSVGTLRFTSTFTQTAGTLQVSNGGALQFDNSLNLAAGYLIGSGSVIGNVTSSGVISPSSGSFNSSATPGQLSITGNLSLLSVSSLLFELGGATKAGTDYDFLAVSGTAALGSAQLNVGFTNGFTATAAQTFTLLTATGGLSGAFGNVPNGQRLFISGGSFLVNYGAGSAFAVNSVVLSNFVAVPEPATWTLLLAGLASLTLIARRRASR